MIIAEPTLLLDPERCRNNLGAMLHRANEAGVTLRPHCKTHQSRVVGRWLRRAGIDRITVSSLAMAEYFADDGWENILIAFPFNPRAADRYSALADRCRLGVLLDNPEALAGLAGATLDFYVDIDTGYGRTGVPAGSMDRIEALLASARRVPGLVFRGFYCHPGNTYHHAAVRDRQSILSTSLDALGRLKAHFASDSPTVLVGDTPGCSGARAFPGADEITPGNFVFYDLFQAELGTCSENDIAVALACPVVGRYPERGEIVIHGGSVHFSRDSLDLGDQVVFGKLAAPDGAGWRPDPEPVYLTGLSQEHGTLRLPPAHLDRVRIGDLVHLLPVHSCLTADAMGGYHGVDGQPIDHLAGACRGSR